MWDVILGPNPRQCHVYHLRRSGGHGLIDWLLAHHDEPKIHYNQAYPLGRGMIGARSDQIHEVPGVAGKPRFPLLSIEDTPLDFIAAAVKRPRLVLLLLRDPFNMFASRLGIVRKHRGRDPMGHANANRINPALWKQYAREFLEPHYLPHAVRVNYNSWYTSADYRRQLAEHLGWKFTDRGFGSTDGWRFSQGSSFGQTDAKSLDLLGRWKFFAHDAEYAGLFDDEIRQLSKAIFDFVPPLPLAARRVARS
jgi:hypothetical protein